MRITFARALASLFAIAATGLGTIALAVPPTSGTGPGGFITTGGTSDMLLWTKADTGVTLVGPNVTAWNDQSGRGNNLGTPINGANITLQANDANSILPSISFANRSGLQVASLIGDGFSGETFFIFRTSSDNGGNNGGFYRAGFAQGGGNDNQHATWGDGNIYEPFATDLRQSANPAPLLTAHQIYNVYGRSGTNGTVGDPAWATTIDGTILMTRTNNGVANYFDPIGNPGAGNSDWWVGLSNSPATWTGHIAEVVFLNRTLNLAERMIVENSLHSKYAIAGALEAGTDFYSGDTPGNGNFDFDVFGVGRTNDSQPVAAGPTVVNQVTAAGAAGFGIEATPGTLDPGEFIMAGHKVGTNALTSADIDATLGGERWTREWFVDTNGDAVGLQLAFDFANDGIASTDALDDYQLLFRPNESSDYLILSSTGTISGNNVLFNLNSTDIGNGLVTLGINVAAVPEPATIAIWSLVGVVGLTVAWRRRKAAR